MGAGGQVEEDPAWVNRDELLGQRAGRQGGPRTLQVKAQPRGKKCSRIGRTTEDWLLAIDI